MEGLKQVLLDNDLVDLEAILDQFNLYGKTCQDYLKFDCSELTKPVKISCKLTTPENKTTPTPALQKNRPYVNWSSNHQPETTQTATVELEWCIL